MSGSASSFTSQELRAQTLELEPGRFRFSVWHNVSITLWTAQATVEAAERVLRVSRQLNRRFPEGRSQVMIVVNGTPAPEGQAKEMLTEVYDPSLSRIVCFAAVLEGSGFWASGVRSRMTNMQMVASSALATRTHETIDEVVTWLPQEHARRTGVVLETRQLAAVLASVRELETREENVTD